MYHAHFGLQKGLFGDGIAADTAVFRSAKHDQVVAHFKLAFGSPSAALVLRGPAGVGKTTLTATTLRANATRLALAWLNGMPTNATELLELVLVELGVDTVRTTRIERLQLWRQFQGEMRATESRLFVVVERTEDLSSEVLHALDQLTAPDAVGNPGANLVLLGHATIDEHLAAPVLDSLRQRVRVRTDLPPFTEAELQDYLRHQVACAGGHYDRIFAPGTVAALHRYSGGVARLANTLCETALDFAANQLAPALTPELLTNTAVSVLGLGEAAPAARAAAATPSESAAVVATRATPVIAPSAPTRVELAAVAPLSPAPVKPAIADAAPAATLSAVAAPPATPVSPLIPVAAPALIAGQAASTAPAAAPAPTARVAATTASAPAPIAAPTSSAARPTLAVSTNRKPEPVEFEFDGGATDITDVAMADFPVLTDAVEMAGDDLRFKRPAAAPAPSPPAPPVIAARPPISQPAPASRAATAVGAAKPAAAAPSRVETAYTAPKAAPAAPKPAPVAPAIPAVAPLRVPAIDSEDDDLLRQTQTMRAIAVAKSIDDISSSMAETLFGDAELDLVTAALASAAEWADDEKPPAGSSVGKPEPAKVAAKIETAQPAAVDDPWDLFGLGDDAPLELIDDSTLPPVNRKSAAR